MVRPKVLLRQRADGAYEQVAVLDTLKGKRLSYREADGSHVERDRRSDERNPDMFSVKHLFFAAPEALRRAVAEDPVAVIKQLLIDASTRLDEDTLRKRLAQDVGKKAADHAWGAAKNGLRSDPDVLVDEDPVTYLVTGADNPAFAAFFPDHGPNESEASTPIEGAVAPPIVEAPVVPAPEEHDVPAGPAEQPGTSIDVQEARSGGAPVEGATTAAAPVTPASLRHRLVAAYPDLPRSELTDLASRPLALAALVGRAPAASIRKIADGLPRAERFALAAATARRDVLANELAAAPVDEHERRLRLALRELDSHREQAAALKAHLLPYVQRAADAEVLAPDDAITAASRLAAAPVSEGALTWVLEHLETRVHDGPPREALGWRLGSLAAATRALRLDRDGTRARLLVELFGRGGCDPSAELWWGGTSVAELAEAARGRLGAVLDRPDVATKVVAPTVAKFLQDVPTRGTVAAVFSWPPTLASHVPPAAVAKMLGAVAQTDDLASSWVRVVTDEERLVALDTEVARSRSTIDHLQDRVRKAEEEATRLREDLVRTADQLAAARRGSSAASDAHDRQLRIDGVRAIALMAAQVAQSPAAREDQALTRQVEHACARQGLQSFAQVGESIAYDPAVHDALSPRLLPGSPVSVVRTGYTWANGDDRAVVLKAQVVAVQE